MVKTTGPRASLERVDHLEAVDGETAAAGPLASLERVDHQVDGEEAVAGPLESLERVVVDHGMIVVATRGHLESLGRVDINQDDLRS